LSLPKILLSSSLQKGGRKQNLGLKEGRKQNLGQCPDRDRREEENRILGRDNGGR
jgi:hypothetical protein